MKLRVATWNISGGVSADDSVDNYFDQEKRPEIDFSFLKEIVKTINEEEIDIIALQEVITTDRIKYVEYILSNTQLKYYSKFELSECNLVENTMSGIAIISKYPIIDSAKMLFTNPKLSKTTSTGLTYYTYDKGCMNSTININDKLINFITNHGFPFGRFDSNETKHLYVFNELKVFIEKYNNVIVTGDFNAENVIALMPGIEKKVIETIDEVTTTNDKKLDNILIDKNFSFINKKIIKSISDHFLCISTIKI